MKEKSLQQKGFSLTEMSVVMVILAIIIASVLKGEGMIEAARMRAVIAEVSEYKVAVNSFNSKYGSYPGDFNEADAFWSGALSGDNDGTIEFVNQQATPVYEGYNAWQHLAYAEIVNVPYVGTRTTGVAVLDTDIPMSKTDGGYFFNYEAFGLTGSNTLVLGTPVNIGGGENTLRVDGNLNPSQAMDIDSKSDDGLPNSGSIRGADGDSSSSGSCVNDNSTPLDSSDDFYTITNEVEDCAMAFRITTE